jgi:hypothetical protein
LKKNKEVAVDVLNLLDSIRFRIQKEVQLKLNHTDLPEAEPHRFAL